MGFDPGAGIGPDGSPFGVEGLILQPDDQLLVFGHFEQFDGQSNHGITRLNPGAEVTLTLVNLVPYPYTYVYEYETNVTLEVWRAGDRTPAFTVDYRTQNESAVGGQDYLPVAGTLHFQAGEIRKTVSIPILDDELVDSNKTFKVILQNPSLPVRLGDSSSATVTIGDDDFEVEFTQTNYFVRESENFATISVGRIGSAWRSLYQIRRFGFEYTTIDGTAHAGREYETTTGRMDISNHREDYENRIFSVPIRDNREVGSRTIILALTNPVGGLLFGPRDRAILTILDNDTAAGAALGFNNKVLASALQRDGKLLVGGDFTTVDGLVRNHLARLNPGGSLDETFALGSGFNGSLLTISIQPDGKILTGGFFTECDGRPCKGLARLNPDGSRDPSFITPYSLAGPGLPGILAIALQTDGKILAGGNYTIYYGFFAPGLVRLLPNGWIDQSFVPAIQPLFGHAPPVIRGLAIEPSGKVLVAGQLKPDPAAPGNGLIRLNPDGSEDLSFSNRLTEIRALAVQSDEKILAAGAGGRPGAALGFFRLTPDGRFDPGFKPDPGIAGSVEAVTLQADDKILLAGEFSFEGYPRFLLRLNPDGSVDRTFKPNRYRSISHTVTVDAGGGLFVGGEFSGGLDGNFFFQRLKPAGELVNDLAFAPLVRLENGEIHLAMRGQAGSRFILQGSANFIDWVNLQTNSMPIPIKGFVDSGNELQRRFYRIRAY